MPKISIKTAPIIFLFLAIMACSKERLLPIKVPIAIEDPVKEELSPKDTTVVNTSTFSGVNTENFLKSIRPAVVKNTIESRSKLPIIGPKGTKIYFSPEVLRTIDGLPVDFPFEYELLEIYDTKDMLLHQKFTRSDDNVLKSGGEVYFQLYKNGKALTINDPVFPIQYYLPSKNVDNTMFAFTSQGTLNDTVNWQPMPEMIAVSQTLNNECVRFTDDKYCLLEPIQIYQDSYLILAKNFGWINCDRFLLEENLTRVKFASTEFKPADLRLFMIIPSINSVILVDNFISLKIPIGTEVKVIGISADKDKNLKYFFKQFTVEENQEIDITMESILESDFKLLIETL